MQPIGATADRLNVRAAITPAVGAPFAIETLVMDPPGPDQVRVAIRACGVCHTDLVLQHGALPVPFPVILGHEGAGVIEAVGPGVTDLAVGDHVLLSFDSCGTCPACHDHQPGYCVEFVPRNFLASHAPQDGGLWRHDERISANIFGQSAFATHAYAHPRNVVKIAPELPLDVLAPLGCGIQTGAGTVLETLQVARGEAVLVMGAGAVGLAAVMAARIAGAGRIAVVDLHTNRLALAESLGAHETSTDLAGLAGGFHHAIDTTGVSALLPMALDKLVQRGTLALVGAYAPGAIGIEPAAVMSMGRRIVGVVEGGIDPQRFIPRLIDHYLAGELPLERLITFFPFDQIEAACAQSASGAVIKPVLRM
ncbi:NAD(P)-dependent alcohol dehydrogenase [Novosphingobium piscinae]|uniref:NAD(P)-dependent alcohol dehydrogenase n=2 Tax=Novosphingobium piscinae TaxID=1507448 RepID=A0A7X1FV67_9SPHN|nr:NAD(P)-dependent alcohol dehydrogenase [Novosphingobium piscinae]